MTFKSITRLPVLVMLVVMLTVVSCTPQATATTSPDVSAIVIPTSSIQARIKVLTILHPQSPTMLNIHLTNSVKDFEPARIVYEPLAVFNKEGALVPVLADGIPSRENGQLAEDGKSVIWKLRQDISWSDGVHFTAHDVVFTYDFITDPDVKSPNVADYSLIKDVEAMDDYTVKVTFNDINPAWAVPFVGIRGVIIPRHIFSEYKGENALKAPANTMPVGTGPYRVVGGIKPQEVLLLGSRVVQTTKIVYEPNPYYRSPEKIAFDRIVWRGGGTVNEAARLSLQVGDVDVAYDLDQVDTDYLSQLQKESQGKLVTIFAPGVERILLNRTDPNHASASGEYSSIEIPHPLFNDLSVRQAFAYAINRDEIAALYGANGIPAYAILVSPPQYQSKNPFYSYDPEKAKALLEQAGYIDEDGDGIREKDGADMKVVFRALVGTIPQRAQKIIQQNLNDIGVDVELKITDSSIMFGAGASNPDSASRFNSDLLMFRTRSTSPDPTSFMSTWTCVKIPKQENNWTGNNNERWCNSAYDDLLNQARVELDPAKREEIFIKLNDMYVEDVAGIPLVWRASAIGVNQYLTGTDPTPWDSFTWNIQDWQIHKP